MGCGADQIAQFVQPDERLVSLRVWFGWALNQCAQGRHSSCRLGGCGSRVGCACNKFKLFLELSLVLLFAPCARSVTLIAKREKRVQ